MSILRSSECKINAKKVGQVNRGQVKKSKVRDEYTISCGSGISYIVFTCGHMLSTCTHLEYIFLVVNFYFAFCLSYVFHKQVILLSSSCGYILCHILWYTFSIHTNGKLL